MAEITDEEQIEALKRWWSKNGTSTIIIVVLAIAAALGYQAWQRHQRDTGQVASGLYQQLLDAVAMDSPLKQPDKAQIATAKRLALQLEDSHSGSTYAHLAAMYLAKLAVDDGDLDSAAQQLNWALGHGLDRSLVTIVKMRLARVQLAQKQPAEALKTLGDVEPGQYRPSYDQLKGDIYRDMGDKEKAREAYQRAVNALGQGQARPLLQMKLDELAPPSVSGTVAQPVDKQPAGNEAK